MVWEDGQSPEKQKEESGADKEMHSVLIDSVEDPEVDTCVPGTSFLLKASLWPGSGVEEVGRDQGKGPREAGLTDAVAREKTFHFSSRWRHLAGYLKRAGSVCGRCSQTAGPPGTATVP